MLSHGTGSLTMAKAMSQARTSHAQNIHLITQETNQTINQITNTMEDIEDLTNSGETLDHTPHPITQDITEVDTTELEEEVDTTEDIDLLMEDIMAQQDIDLLTEIIRQGTQMELEEEEDFINVSVNDTTS
jgi:hypothetical protein